MDKQSMQLIDLIADAKNAGLRLAVRKGRLVVRGPKSAWTEGLDNRLRVNARALVAWKTAPPEAVHYVDISDQLARLDAYD